MKKRIWFKLISVLMVLCICGTGFAGCKDEASDDNIHNSDYEISINESKAISIAKESSKVQKKIADCWDMKFFYTPEWGTCTAEKKYNGDWEVVLKGNISGYTDDYKDDFIYDKKFPLN